MCEATKCIKYGKNCGYGCSIAKDDYSYAYVCCLECGDECYSGCKKPMLPSDVVYVNVYEVEREYGGPEEGGWWYNSHDCVQCVPCLRSESEYIKTLLTTQYEGEAWGNIYSMAGGMEIAVYIQEEPEESDYRKVGRPHYE